MIKRHRPPSTVESPATSSGSEPVPTADPVAGGTRSWEEVRAQRLARMSPEKRAQFEEKVALLGQEAVTESRYSGVSWSKRDGGVWVARLQVDGKRREVGSSKTVSLAALKWNRALIESVGGVAGVRSPRRLNTPPCVGLGLAVPERLGCCYAPCSCCCVC